VLDRATADGGILDVSGNREAASTFGLDQAARLFRVGVRLEVEDRDVGAGDVPFSVERGRMTAPYS
jgi:hypothetical protein